MRRKSQAPGEGKIDRTQFRAFSSNDNFAAKKIIDIFSKLQAGDSDSDDDLDSPHHRPETDFSPTAVGGSSDPFGSLEGVGGDEFMAIKPWLGAIVPPSHFKANDGSAPPIQVTLDYVYGYNAQVKNSVHYTNGSSLVYAAAGLGVVFDPDSNKQSFVSTHTDDVVALAFDSVHNLVATGELGKRPKVVIWDANTNDLKIGSDYSPSINGIIEGCLSRSIMAVRLVMWSRGGGGCTHLKTRKHLRLAFSISKISCLRSYSFRVIHLSLSLSLSPHPPSFLPSFLLLILPCS